jgi:hypothetical protein
MEIKDFEVLLIPYSERTDVISLQFRINGRNFINFPYYVKDIETEINDARLSFQLNEDLVNDLQADLDRDYIGSRNIGKYGRRTELMNAGADPSIIEEEIINYENNINQIASIYKEGQIAWQLLSLLEIVLPSKELLETAKIGLPLLKRTDLVRRYAKLLARIKAPTDNSLYELVNDLASAGKIGRAHV